MIRVTTVMGTSVLTIRNVGGYDHLISQLPTIQSVRWKRKPLWLPTAKTKIFRVPRKPVIPTEERLELQRLYNNYRTYMKSLRSYFAETFKEANKKSVDNTLKAAVEEDFLIRCSINETWNKEVAAERELRLKTERAERMAEIMKKVEAKAERDLLIQKRVDTEIRKAKEESATFITRDNIDETIEVILRNITSHNVAIDFEGNFYPKKPEQVKESVENI